MEKLGLANKLKAINLNTDEILGIDKLRNKENEKVQEILISKIREFKNHPFKVSDGEQFDELVESIKINGVLNPVLVRKVEPNENGCEYEMISGHRRKKASIIAGLETIPCIVRDLNDDQAIVIMVDSNMQRENILPSEKAFAYKLKLEAIKRQAGRPSNNSRQLVRNLESADIIGKDSGESGRQIQRYIRLTELIPEILSMVDEKQIAFIPAVELSYINKEEQHIVELLLKENKLKIDQNKASLLKQNSGNLNMDLIRDILLGDKDCKVNKQKPVRIKPQILNRYFKQGQDQREIEDIIEKALDNYFSTTKEQI